MAASTNQNKDAVPSVGVLETPPMLKFLNTATNQPVEMSQKHYDKFVRERYPLDHLERVQ
jgi:hypothetical protein